MDLLRQLGLVASIQMEQHTEFQVRLMKLKVVTFHSKFMNPQNSLHRLQGKNPCGWRDGSREKRPIMTTKPLLLQQPF